MLVPLTTGTGRFQSYQRILENFDEGFRPDAVSMAKSLGGGFPMVAFWVNEEHGEVLGPGTHGSTFGGSPLASAVGNAVLDIVENENLESNARIQGDRLMKGLREIAARHGDVVEDVRGMGLMCGVLLRENVFQDEDSVPSILVVQRLHELGILTVPSGEHVVRFLPPLNVKSEEVDEGLDIFEKALSL